MSFQDRVAWLVGKPAFWLIFVFSLISFHVVRTMLAPKLPPLPEARGVVAPFRLIDQRGRPFGTPDLTGTIWVAGLTCTKCPSIDPSVAEALGDIQHRSRNLGKMFHVVAISVDPETDTSTVLADFAKVNHASARRWSFLTGDRAEIKRLVASIYLPDPMQPKDTPSAQVIEPGVNHRLALIDQSTQIRGYYDARKKEDIDKLLHEAGLLANLRWRPAPQKQE